MRSRLLLAGLVASILIGSPRTIAASVEFPGEAPGKAIASRSGDVLTLHNSVISSSWMLRDGRLSPLNLINKLTGRSFDQTGSELFRIGLNPPVPHSGVYVGIRLESKRIVALASPDGQTWSELAHFPRSEFTGVPSLVRLGKMNLLAEPKDNPGDLGTPGKSVIFDFSLATAARMEFAARAHQASVRQFEFPSGVEFVSCKIDKLTDKGMSWGPALALVWQDGRKFVLVGLREGQSTFNVTTQGGERILDHAPTDQPPLELASSEFRTSGPLKSLPLKGDSKGTRVADKVSGVAIEQDLVSAAGLVAHWRAELRDGSNYIRQTVTFSSPVKTLHLYGAELAQVHLPTAQAIGVVPGCPVAGQGMFFGVELPGAMSTVDDKGFRISFACKLEISPTSSYGFGSVAGVAPEGQLRRSFLYYVERERARPSSPFLHYNCWYDLGYNLDADKMFDAVTLFHREIEVKRGVSVKSYLVDDGWDNPTVGLWQEDQSRFPGGFAALKERMAGLNAHLGVWISPLGGYGGSEQRTADAQKLGLIPQGSGLDLASPAYKNWFQNRCLQLMREDGVNAFKWDRAGDGVSPHFMALLDIARNLRKQNKDVFVNVTVGTWPSPFWLNHVDSTWRMGSADVGWAGKGDTREKWLTFRDGNCKKMFVDRSPLYPLNSVMHHGIVHGREFQGDPIGKTGAHLKNEVRSYFANGTSLQEMYITPSMMTPEAWDYLAAAAKWAQENSDVLVDSHWVGGDPLKLEPYGYASWNPHKATLMLRNPDDKPRSITLDASTIFELPVRARTTYSMRSPYKDQRVQSVQMNAGKPVEFILQPFEVLVFGEQN